MWHKPRCPTLVHMEVWTSRCRRTGEFEPDFVGEAERLYKHRWERRSYPCSSSMRSSLHNRNLLLLARDIGHFRWNTARLITPSPNPYLALMLDGLAERKRFGEDAIGRLGLRLRHRVQLDVSARQTRDCVAKDRRKRCQHYTQRPRSAGNPNALLHGPKK
jgi:hypothetical protein